MSVLKKNISILSLLTLVFLSVPTFAFAEGTITGIEGILWSLVNTVFGFFMGLAGLLLNYGVTAFVIGFGDQFSSSGVGFVVDALWINVRDIFNITFIFGLVYIGFKMILNSDDSGTRRALVSLILAALLVNFSLFFTKVIVDFSNILATQIVTGGFGDVVNGKGISDHFMNAMNLTSLWGGDKSVGDVGYGYIFGAAILFIVGTFVFAAGGIMLIIRYAALNLYMVMSPLMFLGWVFPGLQRVTSDYWKGFLGRAFFAPAYLLLVFFAYSIINQFYNSQSAGPNFKTLFNSKGNDIEASFGATLAPFILTCIFLIAAVVVASKLSADGASTAMKMGQSLSRRAQRGATRMAGGIAGGATFGLAARAGRNTAGRRAHYLLNSQDAKARNFRDNASKTLSGKLKFQAAQKLAGASFDGRQVNGLGAATGLGSGVTGGWDKRIKDNKQNEQDFAKALGTNDILEADGKTVREEFKARVDEATENELRTNAGIKAAEANKVAKETEKAAAEVANETAKKELAIKQEAIAKAKEPFNKKVLELEAKLERAIKFQPDNTREREAIQKELDETRQSVSGDLDAIDTRFKPELEAAEKEVKDTDAKIKEATAALTASGKIIEQSIANAKKIAQNNVKYARQNDYADQLDKSANFWAGRSTEEDIATGSLAANFGAGAGMAAGSLVGGIALAPLLGAAVAGTAASGRGATQRASAAHIRSLYSGEAKGIADLENQIKQTNLMSEAFARASREQGAFTPPPAPAPDTAS